MDYRRWPKRKDVGRNRKNEFLMPLAKWDETKISFTDSTPCGIPAQSSQPRGLRNVKDLSCS
jgi:hypothetical protein